MGNGVRYSGTVISRYMKQNPWKIILCDRTETHCKSPISFWLMEVQIIVRATATYDTFILFTQTFKDWDFPIKYIKRMENVDTRIHERRTHGVALQYYERLV